MRIRWISLMLGFLVAVFPVLGQYHSKIYYIPFEVRTNEPVTSRSIELNAFAAVSLKHQWFELHFLKMIKHRQECKINENQIRLKVVIGKDVYVFDRFGYGVMNRKHGVWIDKRDFLTIFMDNSIALPLGPTEVMN